MLIRKITLVSAIVSILAISAALTTRSLNPGTGQTDTQVVRSNAGRIATETKHPATASNPQKICFVRDRYLHDSGDTDAGTWASTIYLFDIPKGIERRIADGQHPSLSPTGDLIAFTSYPTPTSATIQVFNLITNRVVSFMSLHKVVAFGPRWSEDGKRFAFMVSTPKRLDVGVLDLSNGEWKNVTEHLQLSEGGIELNLDSWVEADNAVLCHDLNFIYEVRVDGTILQKIAIESFFQRSRTWGGTQYSFSSDKRYLLFDGIEDPENNWIYTFSLKEGKLSQITPDTIRADEPVWLPSGKEVLFRCVDKSRTSINNICKIGLDGKGLTILIHNGRSPSFSMN